MTKADGRAVAYQRGLHAGRLDYPISANPCRAGVVASWQYGWFEGMREAGHQIPPTLKPLERRLLEWTNRQKSPPERP